MSASLVYPFHVVAVHVEYLVACRRSVYADFAAPPCSAESRHVDLEDVLADLLEVGCVAMAGEDDSLVWLKHAVQCRLVAEVVSYDSILERVAVRLVVCSLYMH